MKNTFEGCNEFRGKLMTLCLVTKKRKEKCPITVNSFFLTERPYNFITQYKKLIYLYLNRKRRERKREVVMILVHLFV